MNSTRKVIYIVSGLVVVFFVGFIPPTCQKQSLNKKYSELQKDYNKLEAKYENLEAQRKTLSELNSVGEKFIKSYKAANEKNFGNAKDIAQRAFEKLENLEQSTKNKKVSKKIDIIMSRKSSILQGLENTETSVLAEINNVIIDCMEFFPSE